MRIKLKRTLLKCWYSKVFFFALFAKEWNHALAWEGSKYILYLAQKFSAKHQTYATKIKAVSAFWNTEIGPMYKHVFICNENKICIPIMVVEFAR